MKINGINNYLNYSQQAKNQKESPVKPQAVKEDKLELSSAALQKNQELDKAANKEEIMERINNKFYFKKEVTEKIAERLIKDLK